MKKLLLALCIPLFITSCGNSGNNNNQLDKATLSAVKDVLNSFSTSTYQVKGYEASFTESYQMSATNSDEDGSSTYSLNYQAEGKKIYSYSFSSANEVSSLPLDIISKSNGFYYATQKEKSIYECHEYDADHKEIYTDSANVNQNHSIAIGFDNSLFNAVGSETYRSVCYGKEDVDFAHIFQGSIDKSLLLGELSSRVTQDALENISFTDAMKYIQEIDSFFMDMMPKVKNYNDDQLKDFVKNNKLVTSKKEGNIKINLNYDASALEELLDVENLSNVRINAELLFDQEGQLLNFKYDLKDFLLSLITKENNGVTINQDTLVFNVEGKVLKTALEDKYSYQSDEYDDPSTYINDFHAKGLPYIKSKNDK